MSVKRQEKRVEEMPIIDSKLVSWGLPLTHLPPYFQSNMETLALRARSEFSGFAI